MGLLHYTRCLRAVLRDSCSPQSDTHVLTSPLPVYLKPSRSSRRKPSYFVSRMRDPVPSYAYKAPHLGNATPLFCVTSPSCEYFALRLPLVKAGFRRPSSLGGSTVPCNVLWGRSMYLSGGDSAHVRGPLRASLASPHQRFNHFPHSHGALGCKWGLTQQLRRAERALAGGNFAQHYDFFPRTWLYPDESEALVRVFSDAPPTQRFIWKPARGSCGRGIFTSLGGAAGESTWRRVTDEIERRAAVHDSSATGVASASAVASRRYVVQEYVENPLLLDKRKTDLRLYVAVTSYDPLTVYLHEEGLVRLAAQSYGAGGVKLNFDPFRDLTNYSIGKHWGTRNDQKQEVAAEEIVCSELKRSLADLWAHIDSVRPMPQPVSVAVRGEIARVIVKTLLAVKFSLVSAAAAQRKSVPCGFFELYGFDVMLDADFKPWLVEVNTLPSLASTSPLDYAVKTNVVADLLNLAMIEPFERPVSCFGEMALAHASLKEPLSLEAQQTVHRMGFDTTKPLEKREAREEVRQRLLDEQAYCRGFHRIFPPLPGDVVGAPVMADIATLSRENRLSLADEWALDGCPDASPARRSPPLHLSAEEEALLLAKYGAAGPYDDLLALPAVSKSVFEYGGRDVFLTGTGDDGDSSYNDGNDEKKRGDDVHLDPTLPLDCLLLRRTNILSTTTPAPLWDSVAAMLTGSDACSPSPPPPQECWEVLLSAREAERRAGEETGAGADDFGDGEELTARMDALMREADDLLARHRDRWVDPENDEWLVARRGEILAEQQMWMEDLKVVDLSGDEGSGSEDQMCEKPASGEMEQEGEGALGKLFAYEFGPTAEVDELIHKWDEVIAQCDKVVLYQEQQQQEHQVDEGIDDRDNKDGTIVLQKAECEQQAQKMLDTIQTQRLQSREHRSSDMAAQQSEFAAEQKDHSASFSLAALPVPLGKCGSRAALLESIDAISARDGALEAAAEERLLVTRDSQQRHFARNAGPGRLVLEPFDAVLDSLLPPAVAEPLEPVPPAAIERRADKRLFAVNAAVEEARRMAEEDARALVLMENVRKEELARQEEIAHKEEQARQEEIAYKEEQARQEEIAHKKKLARICEALNECAAAAARAMATVAADEAGAFAQLLEGTGRHALAAQESKVRTEVEAQWSQCVGATSAERRRCVAIAVAATATAAAGRKAELSRRVVAAKMRATRNTWGAVAQRKDMRPSPSGVPQVAARVIALREEERAWGVWLRDEEERIRAAADALAEDAADERVEKQRGPRITPHSGTQSNSNAVDQKVTVNQSDAMNQSGSGSGVCLDAALARRVLLLTPNGDPREAARRCRAITLSMEHIAYMDFCSLSALRLRDGTPAAALVQDLDLSGNALTTLPLDDMLRSFPAVRRLCVSDNALRNVTCGAAVSSRAVAEAQANAAARVALLRELDVSSNALENLDAVGKLLAYTLRRLIGFANSVMSLHPLTACTRVESLELSRNRVVSVEDLQSLVRLRAVDLNDNCIERFDAIAQHVLLQDLLLARNRISALPCAGLSFAFLRQLYLNENALVALPVACMRWLPQLTVLHADGNRLSDVSGLAHCPRLTVVSLALNALASADALAPLAACRALESLAMGRNPFALDATARRRLLAMCPRLRELNHEPVAAAERSAARAEELRPLSRFVAARAALRARNACALPGASCAEREVVARCVAPAEATAALASGAALRGLIARGDLAERRGAGALPVLRRLVAGSGAAANECVAVAAYEAKARAHREGRAAALLRDWIRIQCRRRRRRSAAAMVIQPVGRGALVRARLWRALYQCRVSDEEDDGALFAPVALDALDSTLPESGGIGEVLQSVLRARPEAFQCFALSPRPHSSHVPAGEAGKEEAQQRLSSRPQSEPQPHHAPQPPPQAQAQAQGEVGEEVWGPLVRSQLRRRQDKRDRAQRERMRRELMLDPLAARRAKGQ